MARVIPNEECWVGFVTTAPAGLDDSEVTAAEIGAATNLTPLLSTINPSAQGNVIPTPSLDSLFETSTVGTSQANFTADFYRDDTADTAWTTLTRGVKGYFIIGRFSLSGTTTAGKPEPDTGDDIEIWPVIVSSRASQPLANNTVQQFSITCAVFVEPKEDAVVVA